MKEFFVAEAGGCLRYNDLPGEGMPILLLHGLGCACSFDYAEVLAQPALAGRRRIAVDLLGAGYSDKPAGFAYTTAAHAAYLARFAEALGLGRFILLGHSLGGAVAIELAARIPEKIERLILTESNLDGHSAAPLPRAPSAAEEAAFLEGGFAALMAQTLAEKNTMWAATLANWSPLAYLRLARCSATGGDPSWRQTLYGLPMPRDFLFGARTLPSPDYAELPRHGVRVHTVPDAGHSMAWENPAGLAAVLGQCLAGS